MAGLAVLFPKIEGTGNGEDASELVVWTYSAGEISGIVKVEDVGLSKTLACTEFEFGPSALIAR